MQNNELIKVDRIFLEHIINVLRGEKPEAKEQLIIQLKTLVTQNKNKITSKRENRTIAKPLVI